MVHILSDHSDGSDVGFEAKLHVMELRRNLDSHIAFRRTWEAFLLSAHQRPVPISLSDVSNPATMFTIFQKELISLIISQNS